MSMETFESTQPENFIPAFEAVDAELTLDQLRIDAAVGRLDQEMSEECQGERSIINKTSYSNLLLDMRNILTIDTHDLDILDSEDSRSVVDEIDSDNKSIDQLRIETAVVRLDKEMTDECQGERSIINKSSYEDLLLDMRNILTIDEIEAEQA